MWCPSGLHLFTSLKIGGRKGPIKHQHTVQTGQKEGRCMHPAAVLAALLGTAVAYTVLSYPLMHARLDPCLLLTSFLAGRRLPAACVLALHGVADARVQALGHEWLGAAADLEQAPDSGEAVDAHGDDAPPNLRVADLLHGRHGILWGCEAHCAKAPADTAAWVSSTSEQCSQQTALAPASAGWDMHIILAQHMTVVQVSHMLMSSSTAYPAA